MAFLCGLFMVFLRVLFCVVFCLDHYGTKCRCLVSITLPYKQIWYIEK